MLNDANFDRLDIIRVMRRYVRRSMTDLEPTYFDTFTRVHWIFSKVSPRCYDLTGIANDIDDDYALRLANRMRDFRRQTFGYRTFMDFHEDTKSVSTRGWGK